MPRNLDLTIAPAPRWNWLLPSAKLTPAEYSREIMANARRYAKAPEALPYNVSGIEVRPVRTGKGFTISLCYMSGSGWGGQTRERIATWEGGKRWTLTGAHRGDARSGLDGLHLPESDGRYLVRGAPERPAKGVKEWKARWTVGRGALAGLTAVVGEGIDDSAIVKRMQNAIANHEGTLAAQQTRHDEAIADLAALPAMHDVAVEIGRLRARLLRFAGIGEPEATYRSVSNLVYRRGEDRFTARYEALIDRAAQVSWSYAKAGGVGMSVGVRMTLSNGKPRHSQGPYSDAHRVGERATAPDWNPGRHCGNGLHYIPFIDEAGRLRDMTDCVQWAMSYGDNRDFALWIVKAGEARTMIDGHKAKAEHLTPLQRVGSLVRPGDERHPRLLGLLKDWQEGTEKRERLAHSRDAARVYIHTYTREIATLKAALRDYRKAGRK